MMTSRKGFRVRLGRRKQVDDRLKEATEHARREGRELARRRRMEARRKGHAAQREAAEHAEVRLRGAAHETRRRLGPAGAVLGGFLSRVAPRISASLLLLVSVPAALIALLLELATTSLSWLRARLSAIGGAVGGMLQRQVTRERTIAFVGAAAAVGLGISQFFDYHGVAVDAPEYAGEVGVVAPAPLTDTQPAGDAHLYVLLGVAAAALVLIALVQRGRRDLARWVLACGIAGILVSLAIDLPQGLDAGRAGLAFSGSEARLLEGFWAQLACSAVIVFCGLMMGTPVPERAAGRERRRRLWPTRGRGPTREGKRPGADVGGFRPGARARW
jgi:hypothetical protein